MTSARMPRAPTLGPSAPSCSRLETHAQTDPDRARRWRDRPPRGLLEQQRRPHRQGLAAHGHHGEDPGVPGRRPRGGPVEVHDHVQHRRHVQREGRLQRGRRNVQDERIEPDDHPRPVDARGLSRGLVRRPVRPCARQCRELRDRQRPAHDHAQGRRHADVRGRRCSAHQCGRLPRRGLGHPEAHGARRPSRPPARPPGRRRLPPRSRRRLPPRHRRRAPGPAAPSPIGPGS